MPVTIIKISTVLLILASVNAMLYDDTDYPNQSEHQVTNENYAITHKQYENEDKQQNRIDVSVPEYSTERGPQNDLSEHAMVNDNDVFPYMASILRGSQYLSSGALVDENWVLTSADGLFLMMDSIRFLRVRLGSTNYKKGGVLMPVKLIEIHPYFDDKRPNYDLALIMLAKPVRYTPTMKAIRVQMTPKEVTATHFMVTSWPGPLETKPKKSGVLKSIELIKHQRIMTVTHLHPSDPEECTEELKDIGTNKEAIMCLDPPLDAPCIRDIGAPVVLNHILWAVVSSWSPDDCEENPGGPIFATFVSAKNVSSWIHGTIHGHRWVSS